MRHILPSAFLVAVVTLGAGPAAAIEGATRMSPEAFESFAEGHTLSFMLGSVPYGVEQYLPGRRVLWAFVGEECREGVWFPVGQQICFEYDDEPHRLHCWSFYETPDGVLAQSEGMGGTVQVQRSTEPMFCPGPEVGA
ncbi:MAG: hypothetical protein ACXIUV_07625 [Alkalilacustris sp.]